MRFRSLSAFAVLLATAATPAQDPGPDPLRLAFVGDPDSERGRAFERFLTHWFGAVDMVERSGCDPAALRDADVVLLDWGQNDNGIMTWFQDRTGKRVCPLGERDDWDVPTVLLGSAGLNLATLWGLEGSYG